MASHKSNLGRTRNFTCLVYPDSAPDDWKNILSELSIPCFISPLHENDLDNHGEQKKPHYHVILMFDSVKTLEQAEEIFNLIGGVKPPNDMAKVQSLRGCARYLCHLDDPAKAQYDVKDVICFGGADYQDTINLVTDRLYLIREMLRWCRENECWYYSDLFEYAEEFREDWYRVLCENGTYVIKEYLKSKTYKIKEKLMKETGC